MTLTFHRTLAFRVAFRLALAAVWLGFDPQMVAGWALRFARLEVGR